MARPGRGRYCSVLCSQTHRSGANHYAYRGGLAFDKRQRRWRIMCRDGSQQMFARAVLEGALKRPLLSSEVAHHINDDPEDDRPENLRLTTRREHPTLHRMSQ